MRSPPETASDLRRCGIRLMSTANNHALDYSYGGLFSTHQTLDKAGIAHAGSGMDLASARSPAFVDAGRFRVALVSMTTTSAPASRAGMPHDGTQGRPGVNPLRFHLQVDSKAMSEIAAFYTALGWWVVQVNDREWQVNPPGLHMSVTRYFVSEGARPGMVLDQDDVDGNLRAIRNAKAYADIVIVHVHNHEWDQAKGPQYPPEFLPPFARTAIDAGGDVIFAQGGHEPIRDIELFKGKLIVYDTGDLFSMAATISHSPHDFYVRHAAALKKPVHEALTCDVLPARQPASASALSGPGIPQVARAREEGRSGQSLYLTSTSRANSRDWFYTRSSIRMGQRLISVCRSVRTMKPRAQSSSSFRY
jgi:poly-gamma-glutamate capsule biosynthesis protein CapA/YwtB (metallophosphatase superfamily)